MSTSKKKKTGTMGNVGDVVANVIEREVAKGVAYFVKNDLQHYIADIVSETLKDSPDIEKAIAKVVNAEIKRISVDPALTRQIVLKKFLK